MTTLGRVSGVLVHLFSLRSRDDFGIGDFGALPAFFDWMAQARQKLVMLLPLLPTAPGDPSPYATRSAVGLNPLFIDLSQVPEFVEAGGIDDLPKTERAQLDEARASKRIRYDLVFPLKNAALRRAFDRFYEDHWTTHTARAHELQRWQEAEKRWLEPYALFASMAAEQDHRPWWDWPAPIRDRDPAAIAMLSQRLSHEVLFRSWLQWVAETQWQQVRAEARKRGILLCGDEPFIIGQDSADAWANPHLLRRDARLGVPPDDFSATGQDWGLPYFDYLAMQKDDYAWLRFRARKAASYYDVRRVDHAVGYFRQWIRDEKTPTGRFFPEDASLHRDLGERHFRILSEGAPVIAEDLGVVPPWARQTLSALGIPGYRVLRWEKDGLQFRDPHAFPKSSLVTTGTHDTETVREWWEQLQPPEREAAAKGWPELSKLPPKPELTPEIHRALLATAINAQSDLCVLPWQDVVASRERVNLPGSMNDANWAYRMEQDVSELLQKPETLAAARLLAELCAEGRRSA